ncbi:MAG: c-type cytochrome, partial [Anaerolineales bacterium]|nr:c-type cytochrome [Anaerolineales bacterium]
LHFVGRGRLENAPEVAARPVAVAADETAVARGEHLVTIGSCRLCHGAQLEGGVMMDGELGSFVPAPNLTAGAGGIGATFTAADWERALRHGIGGDGRTLVIMPSTFYAHLSDADLGAMIAYLQQAPPVDSDLGPRRMGFPGTVIGGIVAYDDFTRVNAIDHAAVGGAAPAAGPTAAYGAYLVNVAMCGECHAANLAGLVGEDGPPPGPNLTPGGDLGSWTEADFITALRSGMTPDGRQLDGELMPWPSFATMSDVELQAIWAHLSGLPPLPANTAN